MQKTAATLAASLASLAILAPVPARAIPEGFRADVIATGLDLVAVKAAPDGRVFLTEKKGRIRVIKDDKLVAAPFADISARTDATREKGLLGLAIDPDYLANKFIYAFHVDKNNTCSIVRWTADGDLAAAGSEKMIFDLGVSGDKDYHHGGDIAFGGDGKLYITRGNRQDVERSREQTSLFGKLLRINKDGSIPEDNPRYAENQGNARSVYAWGLRNPSSIALQPETGRMHFVDIADNTFDDEIDEVRKGAHYGAYSAGTLGPLHRKGAGGSAIMGGVFYNRRKAGDRLSFPPQYHGKYFWGQFGGNGIRILDPASRQVSGFDGGLNAPINFDIDAGGSIWAVTRTTQVTDTKGQVIKIRYPAGETPTRIPARAYAGPAPRWEVRSGGTLRVIFPGAAPSKVELLDLEGRLLAEALTDGKSTIELIVREAHGLAALSWSGPQGRATTLMALP